MSLESALSRIAQIETSFTPRPAAGSPGALTGGVSAATATTTDPLATGSAATTDFATLLGGALGAQPATLLGSALAAQPAQTAALAPVTGGSGAGDAIVQIARSQIGQSEQPPGSNDSPAIAGYRTATSGAMAGEPWCAYFASWAARQAGEPLGASGQGFGYVGDIWSWAQQSGRAIPNGPGVTPAPGDLIVFGDHHVGIVEQALPNGSIRTIEGNYDNRVSEVVRGAGEATGYVRM